MWQYIPAGLVELRALQTLTPHQAADHVLVGGVVQATHHLHCRFKYGDRGLECIDLSKRDPQWFVWEKYTPHEVVEFFVGRPNYQWVKAVG